MNKYPKWIFLFSEVNCLLWLVMFGCFVKGDSVDAETLNIDKYVAIGGLCISALFQHWAYYKIYKPRKHQSKEKKQNQKVEHIFKGSNTSL
jgi:hypothetical protein